MEECISPRHCHVPSTARWIHLLACMKALKEDFVPLLEPPETSGQDSQSGQHQETSHQCKLWLGKTRTQRQMSKGSVNPRLGVQPMYKTLCTQSTAPGGFSCSQFSKADPKGCLQPLPKSAQICSETTEHQLCLGPGPSAAHLHPKSPPPCALSPSRWQRAFQA